MLIGGVPTMHGATGVVPLLVRRVLNEDLRAQGNAGVGIGASNFGTHLSHETQESGGKVCRRLKHELTVELRPSEVEWWQLRRLVHAQTLDRPGRPGK